MILARSPLINNYAVNPNHSLLFLLLSIFVAPPIFTLAYQSFINLFLKVTFLIH